MAYIFIFGILLILISILRCAADEWDDFMEDYDYDD